MKDKRNAAGQFLPYDFDQFKVIFIQLYLASHQEPMAQRDLLVSLPIKVA